LPNKSSLPFSHTINCMWQNEVIWPVKISAAHASLPIEGGSARGWGWDQQQTSSYYTIFHVHQVDLNIELDNNNCVLFSFEFIMCLFDAQRNDSMTWTTIENATNRMRSIESFHYLVWSTRNKCGIVSIYDCQCCTNGYGVVGKYECDILISMSYVYDDSIRLSMITTSHADWIHSMTWIQLSMIGMKRDHDLSRMTHHLLLTQSNDVFLGDFLERLIRSDREKIFSVQHSYRVPSTRNFTCLVHRIDEIENERHVCRHV
jgi:hypothetical protein